MLRKVLRTWDLSNIECQKFFVQPDLPAVAAKAIKIEKAMTKHTPIQGEQKHNTILQDSFVALFSQFTQTEDSVICWPFKRQGLVLLCSLHIFLPQVSLLQRG